MYAMSYPSDNFIESMYHNSQEFIFLKQVFQLIKEKLNENFNVFYNTLNDKSKNVLNHFLK